MARGLTAMDWRDAWVDAAWFLKFIQYKVAPFGAALLYWAFGPDGNRVPILAGSFIFLDLITGVLKGAALGVLSSSIGRRGLYVKASLVALIAFGHAADELFLSGDLFKNLFAYGVISSEAISIIENFAAIGIRIPEKAKVIIEAMLDRRMAVIARTCEPDPAPPSLSPEEEHP